ncbi:peptidyl-tRNA hydrolase protein 1 [Chytridiales sp. JEL 0842]|nr:peptidyl-tRNA hydrolase protein 1 [Chytridiales sp. JEL 0842]
MPRKQHANNSNNLATRNHSKNFKSTTTTAMNRAAQRFLIVGLGNTTHPGTRHNVGMMAVDYLADSLARISGGAGACWSMSKSAHGELARVHVAHSQTAISSKKSTAKRKNKKKTLDMDDLGGSDEETVTVESPVMTELLFFKPKGFMNLSGGPVLKASQSEGIHLSNIIVLHDELEKKLGYVARKAAGSTGGHNGLRSIQSTFGTATFERLRIGIDRPVSKEPEDVARYVLGKFPRREVDVLEEVSFPLAERIVLEWVAERLRATSETSPLKGG